MTKRKHCRSYCRHYCYRIDFADGYVYFGVRTCHSSIAEDNGYMGSPVTYATKWLTDVPRVKSIVSVHATRDLAEIAEDELILAFWAVSKPLSLNASINGAKFNTLGMKHSAETKAKMSKAHTGKTHTEETRAKMLGRQPTAEHKAKLSAASKGKPKSVEHCAQLSEAHTGKTLSAKHRLSISSANAGKPKSAQHKAKLSAASKGKPKSAEHCAKIGAASKDKPKSAETRAKMSGKQWYTDGVTSIRLKPGSEVPKGFRSGMTKAHASKHNKG